MLPVAEYLDLTAVADRLDVKPSTVSQYRWRNDFPEPDIMIGRSPAWKPETIDAWKASRPGRGAGGGRPPKS